MNSGLSDSSDEAAASNALHSAVGADHLNCLRLLNPARPRGTRRPTGQRSAPTVVHQTVGAGVPDPLTGLRRQSTVVAGRVDGCGIVIG